MIKDRVRPMVATIANLMSSRSVLSVQSVIVHAPGRKLTPRRHWPLLIRASRRSWRAVDQTPGRTLNASDAILVALIRGSALPLRDSTLSMLRGSNRALVWSSVMIGLCRFAFGQGETGSVAARRNLTCRKTSPREPASRCWGGSARMAGIKRPGMISPRGTGPRSSSGVAAGGSRSLTPTT
jgi:hypothetical protein